MRRIAVISPFLNESKGLPVFLQSLESVFANINCLVSFYLVDDGSTDDSVQLVKEYALAHNQVELHLISLEFNSGHQVAIYEGLKKATEDKYDNYIILDSDGQDDPTIIPALIEKATFDVVWVRRSSRSEGIYFQLGYLIYQLIYQLISGRKIDFGNYSIITHRTARYLLVNKYVHYPTALLKSPFSKSWVNAKRLARTYGKSKMSSVNLIHHAFLSFIEDAELVVNFFLKSTLVVFIFFLLSIGNVFYQKFITHTAILGWTSITSIGLLNLVFISFGLFAISLSVIKIGRVNVMEQVTKYEQLSQGTEKDLVSKPKVKA
jgi:glycosyltransferase involved in cell wall biosynthesis